MKKILINLIVIEKHGISRAWLLKYKHLQELGNEIYFHCGKFIKKIEPIELQNVYNFNENFKQIQNFPEISNKLLFIWHALKRNFASLSSVNQIKNNFDVIYSPAQGLDLILLPYIFKKINKKTKWVMVFDNIVPLQDPGNKLIRFLAWLFFKLGLKLIKKADKIFVISPQLKKYLLGKNFKENQIVITGNAVEGKLIKKAKPHPNHQFDAIFIGRLNETKGIYDMLKVLQIIKQKYSNFQLAIMGEGDKKTTNKFKSKIKELNLKNNIQLLGFKTGQEKFDIIKSSKLFLFLSQSESESFGMALLEAVTSGLPAITYNLEPYKHIYQNNEIFTFPTKRIDLIAEKIIEIFEKKEFTNEKGKLLLEKYGSWEKIAEIEYQAIKNL